MPTGTPTPGSRSRQRIRGLKLPQLGSGFIIEPQGRLTLTSGTPVLTSTASGATTVFYALYKGNVVPIALDGNNFTLVTFTELSNVTTASSVGYAGPAAVAASSVYDYYVWMSPAGLALTRGPAWTNTTTRPSTVPTRLKGVYVNNLAITNGPDVNRGTYVGTVASNAGSTIDFIFGAAASGGTAAVLNVWNMFNRIMVGTTVQDNGVSYTYTLATIRQARASAGNQISFVRGFQEDAINVGYIQRIDTAAGLGAFATFGFGFDSTAAFSVGRSLIDAETAASLVHAHGISGQWTPGIGVHTLSANEASDGTNASTFDGQADACLSATILM